MGSSGVEYMTSKEGILRAIIIVFACITFALIASVCGNCRDVVGWILAAYIIAFCSSLLSYIFIASTLASKMQCGISYETVDVCLSVFHFYHTFLASIILTLYNCSVCSELIAANIFGFLLAILYAVEVYFLKDNAPGNLNFLITPQGILKTAIIIFGCTTYAFLDRGGYVAFRDSGCDAGRTWAFAAYIYCWIGSAILFLLRLIGLDSKMGPFDKIDMVWSIFSFLNYIIASIVLAAYMNCVNTSNSYRIAADVFGFIVAILYIIDVIMGAKGGKGVTPAA